MHTVQRSVLVAHSAAQMFNLVTQVEDYPKFLPWCGGINLHHRDEHGLDATIMIHFAGLKHSFRTKNIHEYPNKMTMELVEGPFSRLFGTWEFIELESDACKVIFTLEYAFSSRSLEFVIGPVFNKIANTFIESFTERAEVVYGG